MATSFPTSLDALSNPTSSNKLNDAGVLHADQHANANDAIEALQAKVGIDNSAITTSLDYKVRNVPIGSAVTGLGAGIATFLTTPSSANLISAVTDETGTGTLVFSTSPSVTTSITTSSTSFALINTTATTLNIGGAATTLALGASTGTATIANPTVTLSNATSLNINGAAPTLASTATGTLTLFNTALTGVNAFGAATSITIGGTPTTAVIANIMTNATASATTKTINIGTGAASGSTTSVQIGSSTSGALGNTKFTTGISIATPPAIITGTAYSATINDTALIFNTTASSTVTLPAAATYPGKTIMLKQIAAFTVISASSNVVPLTSTTAGTAILSGAGKFAYLVSDGTNWVTMMAN